METNQTITVNSIVKWKDLTLDGDYLLKRVVEDNGDKVVLMEIDERFSTWPIKPTSVAHKADLIKEHE